MNVSILNSKQRDATRRAIAFELSPRRSSLLRRARCLALLLLLILPTVVQAQFTYVTDNSTIAITGYAGPGGDVVIPSTIEGLPVTSIKTFALTSGNITNVTIPATVTNIEIYAIHSANLANITVDMLNPSYSSLDGVLFDQTQNILIQCPSGRSGSFTIPNTVTQIGTNAFYSCRYLTNITIGENVVNISDSAFNSCTMLSSVVLPDSVATMGEGAFVGCTSLTNITLGTSLTNIGAYAFSSANVAAINVSPLNPSYSSLDGVLFNKNQTALLVFPPGKAGHYTIPNTVMSIGERAFDFLSRVSSVTIPPSVLTIGNGAFAGCANLTTVTFSNGVKSIGDSAFGGCPNLGSVMIPDSVTSIGGAAFSGCNSLVNVTIGSGVTNVGDRAFSECTALKSVSFLNSPASIGDFAFYGTSLSTLVLGNGITRIGAWAFSSCTKLGTVAIPGTTVTIGTNAFFYCISLTNASLGNGVASIEDIAFLFCNLANITIPSSITNIGGGAFGNNTNLVSITVDPLNAVYSSVSGVLFNHDQTELIQFPQAKGGSYAIPSSVTSIEDGTFENSVNLSSITIPDTVTNLGARAFASSRNLTSVWIGQGITVIGQFTFYDCTKLASIIVPDQVRSIGDGAFASCSNLASVSIGSGVTNIGLIALGWCPKLVAITVNPLNSMFSSLDGVFFDKQQTTLIQFPGGKPGSYIIPGSVSNIGYEAFAFCAQLTNVTIPGSIANIESATFFYSSSLVSVTMESGVQSIGGEAFEGCDHLTTVVIPGSVERIGDRAFDYCYHLTNLTIANGVKWIDRLAFAECGLNTITLPDSVEYIGAGAFYLCRTLTNVTIGKGALLIDDRAFSYVGGYVHSTRFNFMGNAPRLLGSNVFQGDDNATVYYLPGTTGWGSTFGGRPTAPWALPKPIILTFLPYFGVQTNRFGFRVSWATNRTTVVEACTNLASPDWVPLATNTVFPNSGWFYFSDPEWTNHPNRFYRVRQRTLFSAGRGNS